MAALPPQFMLLDTVNIRAAQAIGRLPDAEKFLTLEK
jgi:hypothetical protein